MALDDVAQSIGQVGGMVRPTDVPSLESHNRLRAQTQGTPLVEVNWDALNKANTPISAQSPVSPQGMSDPLDIAIWQDRQATAQLSVFDDALARVKQPIQQELDLSYKQYQIDLGAIQNSGMEQQQQAQRINQLNATYQKKWAATKAKVDPNIRAITQQRAAAANKLKLEQAMRMKEIQTYASLAEQGVINEAAAKQLQYKALGYDVPITAFRPEKYQSPYEVMQRNGAIIKNLQGLIDQYQLVGKKGNQHLQIVKPQSEWKNPSAKNPSSKDYRDATPNEIDTYLWANESQKQARAESRQAIEQQFGRKTTDLAGAAAGPMARDISSLLPKPKTPPSPWPYRPVPGRGKPTPTATDVSQMSDEELRALAEGR